MCCLLANFNHHFRYDGRYFCSSCSKFYSLDLVLDKIHCGVCRNKREKVRFQPRRHKSDSIREHYNEKYII